MFDFSIEYHWLSLAVYKGDMLHGELTGSKINHLRVLLASEITQALLQETLNVFTTHSLQFTPIYSIYG